MAGGLELKTPLGSIYSTNITPDPHTGIARYSFAQFDRAMRTGVSADGRNLYPAMPYPSYAKMTGEDMRALYAYLTQDVAPVNQPNRPAQMAWPFSMRWALSLWNWAFLDDTPFKRDTTKDAAWNRGAYLVQGLAHCGACHTPRGIGFQEKAMTHEGARGKFYLAGETVAAWRALSLRSLWTAEDTVLLLKTGKNRFGSVAGSMVEVLHLSTRQFSDDDLAAIATYLKSLPPGKDDLPMPAVPVRLAAASGPGRPLSAPGCVQACVGGGRQADGAAAGPFPSPAQNPCVPTCAPAAPTPVKLRGANGGMSARIQHAGL